MNPKKFIIHFLTAATLLNASISAQTLRLMGSDTLGARLVPQLAEAFKAAGHPQVKFELAAEGSHTAFSSLANGTTHLGMSSRKVLDSELALCRQQGVTLVEHKIAYDLYCVIVNKASHVSALTKEQVAKIFTGDMKDWSELGGTPGPISIYTRNTASVMYKDWQRMAMAGRSYAVGSVKFCGSDAPTQQVAKDSNGISYVGLPYSKTTGVKALPIDGIEPIGKNVENYAYSRSLYIYAPDKTTAEAAAFMAFMNTAEGQEVVRKVGFIPVKDLP
jgi:phosphate transport system substrate-binding protein